ncbi:MAG: cupin domain-containing protein, partial [Muribaculaceae bacterium]|nr:cupin domain-containing protein [Muribaculaceae bacterium]
IKYSGAWKDLGTWASLCRELPGTESGNVHAHNNHGTTILNELALPIISRGCSNIIIAASPDGILVADKESAEAIKESVKEVSLRPMYEERRWGTYRVLDSMTFADGSAALTKCLVLKPGGAISYQRHNHRDEVWTVVDGCGEVVTGTDRRSVGPGSVVVIPAGEMHALMATTRLTLIEVQRGSQLVEEDIERFDFDWSK